MQLDTPRHVVVEFRHWYEIQNKKYHSIIQEIV
jgi:hypothetical protein